MTFGCELAINIQWFMTETLNDIFVLTGHWQSLGYDGDIKWRLGVNRQ